MDSVIIKKKQTKTQSSAVRGSKYAGVSTNGTKWQTQAMIKKYKYYLGCYDDAAEAALMFDIIQVQKNGLHAKTNFDLRKAMILAILF